MEVPPLVLVVLSAIVQVSSLFYSRDQMRESTATLQIGDRAPEFTLRAANREGEVSLSSLLQHGPVILEFLRGTW